MLGNVQGGGAFRPPPPPAGRGLTLAGTGGGGGDVTPLCLISFLLTVRLSPFFMAFRPSFYVSLENFKTLTP